MMIFRTMRKKDLLPKGRKKTELKEMKRKEEEKKNKERMSAS